MKLAILSNVNLDMLLEDLSRKHDVFQTEGYGQWATYALSPNEELIRFAPELLLMWIDGNALLESCVDETSGIAEIDTAFRLIGKLIENYPHCRIAVSNLDVRRERISPACAPDLALRWEAAWEQRLSELAVERGVIPFDLKGIIEDEGRKRIYSDKLWYTGSIPYGIKSLKPFESALELLTKQCAMVRKKVLVLDLDNTLWGGVVGEDGAHGIVLSESLQGAAYRDAQKRILEIKNTGAVLAIASKNNLEDVQAAFRDNPHMVLKESDFVSMKINWDPKPVNIQAMAKELNLGLDSFVFLDDNEVEREAVRQALPEVTVADFPSDPAMLPETIHQIYEQYFWCARPTAEDAARTAQYQQEAERKQALNAAVSMEDYLRSLEIRVAINPVRPEQYERTVQLLNKTNQFNTNTVRMDMQQFLSYLEDDRHQVYVANVSDRYGDSGLVSILLTKADGEALTVENFLMSCRVMGRQIENSIIAALAEHAVGQGIAQLEASFVPTAKNKPVEQLWDRLSFELISDQNGEKHYVCRLPLHTETVVKAEWSE